MVLKFMSGRGKKLNLDMIVLFAARQMVSYMGWEETKCHFHHLRHFSDHFLIKAPQGLTIFNKQLYYINICSFK